MTTAEYAAAVRRAHEQFMRERAASAYAYRESDEPRQVRAAARKAVVQHARHLRDRQLDALHAQLLAEREAMREDLAAACQRDRTLEPVAALAAREVRSIRRNPPRHAERPSRPRPSSANSAIRKRKRKRKRKRTSYSAKR